MKLTPGVLQHCYAFLAETEPFNKWNLPDAEDIKFILLGDNGDAHGTVEKWKDTYKIGAAPGSHQHTASLIVTMAHEMIHLHMMQSKIRNPEGHGRIFKAFAAEVCAEHGFDLGQF
jgi:hypothetical protein